MCEIGTEAASPGGDRLVPFPDAAVVLHRDVKTLGEYFLDGLVPAVELPGGRKATFQSFIDAVLTAARPGIAPTLAEIAAKWWHEHGGPALKKVA
jgi:hypothetical protein